MKVNDSIEINSDSGCIPATVKKFARDYRFPASIIVSIKVQFLNNQNYSELIQTEKLKDLRQYIITCGNQLKHPSIIFKHSEFKKYSKMRLNAVIFGKAKLKDVLSILCYRNDL